MLSELRANLAYLIYDHRYSVTIFWSIFLLSLPLVLLIAYSTSTIGTVGISVDGAVYIFCIVTGILMTKETFPYLIKLGSTRVAYALSVFVFTILLSFFMSVVSVIVLSLVNLISLDNLTIFNTLEVTTLAVTWFNSMWFIALLCFLFLSVGTFISSLFYKFGLLGGLSGIIVIFLLMIIPNVRELVVETFISISDSKVGLNYGGFLLLSVLLFGPYWLILKNASTTSGKTR